MLNPLGLSDNNHVSMALLAMKDKIIAPIVIRIYDAILTYAHQIRKSY